jgi:hypothetical protein
MAAQVTSESAPESDRNTHDTSLLLDFRPQLDAILRVTSWEDGLRTLRLVNGSWVEEWHDWQLAFVGEARRQETHPANGIALSVPEEAAKLAAAAGGYEITALRILRANRQAWEFARSAPNLFWLVCAHLGARNEPPTSNRALFEMPRSALFQMCTGVPASPAAVRFIERFVPYERSQYELHLLRTSARPEVVQLMRWCPRFGTNTLRHAMLAAEDAPLFLPDALRLCGVALANGAQVGDDDAPYRNARRFYDDALDVAEALELDADSATLTVRHVRSVNKLRALHDNWVGRLNAQFPERARERLDEAEPFALVDDAAGSDRLSDVEVLPDSGLADTDDIQAIRTVGDLRVEGHEMANCVAAYAIRCQRAESFIFRVLRPGRATAEVQLRDGGPTLVQLKGPHNKDPSAETRTAVELWLARYIVR